jgi:lipid II:glycine glycyltransferase (peptidoglycan interpeptide bridge formation enzyme)
MTIKEISEKKIWEDFLLNCVEKTFCQSFNWGEFNQTMGDKVYRFGIFDNERLIAVAQTIKIKAKRGTFLFVPHGPVILSGNNKEIVKTLLDYLKELGLKEKASFIRFSPVFTLNEENVKMFKDLGFRNAPIHMHPELTWELNLIPTEEELLKGMRKTTRYLVKQAEKNPDVEIVKSMDEKDLAEFERVYLETAGRHSFTPFPPKYLKRELDAFKNDNEIVIFSGKYKGETVSSAMIVYWSKRAFYHQGASSSKYAKIPVSYLLQWEAIKEAKKRGCEIYNFWGVIPESEKNHPWAGLSLFKKGFGGNEKQYVKTQDYILSPIYWLTYIFEELRKRKRHL